MRNAHITLPGAYGMYEADNKPIDWTARYRHDRPVSNPELAPYWSDLLNRKAERAKIQRFDKCLYHPRRIVRIDIILQRGRQKRSLSAVMALDKAVA